MNLLIDLGNTRLKWACYQDKKINAVRGHAYDADQLSTFFSREWADITKPNKVYVSSDVAPPITEKLQQWAQTQWGVQVQVITPKNHAYGVKNAYENPLQLGSDRWAALVAVKNNIKQPAIIIDCGTAITVDAITASGVHQGGMIVPGIQLMRNALLKGTHKIETTTDHKEISLASNTLASNTMDGIRSGVLSAAVAFINSAVERVNSILVKQQSTVQSTARATMQKNMQIQNIITGGDAEIMLPLLEEIFLHKPNLVLEGLAVILDNTE